MTINRRKLGRSLRFLALPALLSACAGLATTGGVADTNVTITRIVTYAQASLSTLQAVVVAFMPNAPASVTDALNAAENAIATIAAAVVNGNGAVANATLATNVGNLLTIAANAVLAVLSGMPGTSSTVALVRSVLIVAPEIIALANLFLNPTTTRMLAVGQASHVAQALSDMRVRF